MHTRTRRHIGPTALLEIQRVVNRINCGGPLREAESGLTGAALELARALRWFRSYNTEIGPVLGLDLEAAKHLRKHNGRSLTNANHQLENMAALQCVFLELPPAQMLYRQRNVALYRCRAGTLHHVRAVAELPTSKAARSATRHHAASRTALVTFSPRGYQIHWSKTHP